MVQSPLQPPQILLRRMPPPISLPRRTETIADVQRKAAESGLAFLVYVIRGPNSMKEP